MGPRRRDESIPSHSSRKTRPLSLDLPIDTFSPASFCAPRLEVDFISFYGSRGGCARRSINSPRTKMRTTTARQVHHSRRKSSLTPTNMKSFDFKDRAQ